MPRSISLSTLLSTLSLGNSCELTIRGSAAVQTLEQLGAVCSRSLTPPNFSNGACCAELNEFEALAVETLIGTTHALKGAWAAGLNEFPSVPMQRAKNATQSPADE
jgi:hypothetical protein